jgi:hypothetical protein
VAAEEEVVRIAGELAMLTETVAKLADQLKEVRLRADIQQDRIDLAALELTAVTDRLEAAATALREAL